LRKSECSCLAKQSMLHCVLTLLKIKHFYSHISIKQSKHIITNMKNLLRRGLTKLVKVELDNHTRTQIT